MKVAFLDRDGTLIKDKNYLSNVNEIEFFSESFKLLKILRDKNYKLIIVTNQSGLARGLISKSQINQINSEIEEQIKLQNLQILKTYYCPEKEPHPWRKASSGMLLQAGVDFKINYKDSVMLGDKQSDLQSGQRIGVRSFHCENGNFKEIFDYMNVKHIAF